MPRSQLRKSESIMFQLRAELFTAALCGFKSQTEYYVNFYPSLLRDRNAYGETVLEEYKRRGGADPVIMSLITPDTSK